VQAVGFLQQQWWHRSLHNVPSYLVPVHGSICVSKVKTVDVERKRYHIVVEWLKISPLSQLVRGLSHDLQSPGGRSDALIART